MLKAKSENFLKVINSDPVIDWVAAKSWIATARKGELIAKRDLAAEVLAQLTDQDLRREARKIISEITREMEARAEVVALKKVFNHK